MTTGKTTSTELVVATVALELAAARQAGNLAHVAEIHARFTYRMFDISEFFKALKQRFSQFYNTREGRRGPLWEQRFKSVLVEGSEQALLKDLHAARTQVDLLISAARRIFSLGESGSWKV